jgi:hypothetical protein
VNSSLKNVHKFEVLENEEFRIILKHKKYTLEKTFRMLVRRHTKLYAGHLTSGGYRDI